MGVEVLAGVRARVAAAAAAVAAAVAAAAEITAITTERMRDFMRGISAYATWCVMSIPPFTSDMRDNLEVRVPHSSPESGKLYLNARVRAALRPHELQLISY